MLAREFTEKQGFDKNGVEADALNEWARGDSSAADVAFFYLANVDIVCNLILMACDKGITLESSNKGELNNETYN